MQIQYLLQTVIYVNANQVLPTLTSVTVNFVLVT